jgi:hypothetical protein
MLHQRNVVDAELTLPVELVELLGRLDAEDALTPGDLLSGDQEGTDREKHEDAGP